jgi:acylphosphatase
VERKHWDIRITGRVQGVGFRHWVANTASGLEVDCRIRNQHDGSVFIEAEGELSVLQALLDRCRKGPPLAAVDLVERREAPVIGIHGVSIVR